MAQAGVGPAQLGRDVRVAHGEALDVDLVDDRVRVAVPGPVAVLPAERGVARPGSAARARRSPGCSACAGSAWSWPSTSGPNVTDPADRLGVRVEQQLGRVAPQAARRVPRAADPVPVGLPRADARHERVPDVGVVVPHRDLGFRAGLVEQAQRRRCRRRRRRPRSSSRDAGLLAGRGAQRERRCRGGGRRRATRGAGTVPAAVVCVLVMAVPPAQLCCLLTSRDDVADGLDRAVAAADHVGDQRRSSRSGGTRRSRRRCRRGSTR